MCGRTRGHDEQTKRRKFFLSLVKRRVENLVTPGNTTDTSHSWKINSQPKRLLLPAFFSVSSFTLFVWSTSVPSDSIHDCRHVALVVTLTHIKLLISTDYNNTQSRKYKSYISRYF